LSRPGPPRSEPQVKNMKNKEEVGSRPKDIMPMKAAFLTGIRRVEVKEIPSPERRSERDVLLKVLAVGICGSDLLYYKKGRIGGDTVTYPFTIGHECVAEVLESRPGQEKLRPGTRVVVDPAVSCGRCDQCAAGRPHTCRNLRFLGCPGQLSGCLSDFIVLPEENCHPFVRSLPLEAAVLAEPLSIGMYSAAWLKELTGGSEVLSAVVLGSGPIGLATAMAARERGVQRIYMTDRVPERVEAAERVADWSGNPERSDIVAEILSKEPLGVDAVFECCGDPEVYDQAVRLLKPGGKLLVAGIPEVDRVSLPCHDIRRKEITIQHIRRQNRCLPAALRFIRKHEKELAFMVTHRFLLENLPEALEMVSGYQEGVIKAVVSPWPRQPSLNPG